MILDYNKKEFELNCYLSGLKGEILYYKYHLIGISITLVIFWSFAISDTQIFSEVNFISSYFWSGLISSIIYGFILTIYLNRYKEKRDRLFATLPNTLECIIQQKITFVFLLLTFIILSLFVLKLFVAQHWDEHIVGTLRQFGLFFTFLAALSIVYDMKSIFPNLRQLNFSLLVFFLIAFIITVQVIILIYWPEKIALEEVAFLSWGLILAIISQFIHYSKKSFL